MTSLDAADDAPGRRHHADDRGGREPAWPLTRIMGMYIFRNVGPDAMAAVRDGDAKLTEPEYVAGAQALADFAEAGYFGEGFSTRDGDTSSNMFLTGEAAMTYDGSWLLSAINDPERNKIGGENVGFMPFPEVDGGKGIDRPVRRQRRRADDHQRRAVRPEGRRLGQLHR